MRSSALPILLVTAILLAASACGPSEPSTPVAGAPSDSQRTPEAGTPLSSQVRERFRDFSERNSLELRVKNVVDLKFGPDMLVGDYQWEGDALRVELNTLGTRRVLSYRRTANGISDGKAELLSDEGWSREHTLPELLVPHLANRYDREVALSTLWAAASRLTPAARASLAPLVNDPNPMTMSAAAALSVYAGDDDASAASSVVQACWNYFSPMNMDRREMSYLEPRLTEAFLLLASRPVSARVAGPALIVRALTIATEGGADRDANKRDFDLIALTAKSYGGELDRVFQIAWLKPTTVQTTASWHSDTLMKLCQTLAWNSQATVNFKISPPSNPGAYQGPATSRRASLVLHVPGKPDEEVGIATVPLELIEEF